MTVFLSSNSSLPPLFPPFSLSLYCHSPSFTSGPLPSSSVAHFSSFPLSHFLHFLQFFACSISPPFLLFLASLFPIFVFLFSPCSLSIHFIPLLFHHSFSSHFLSLILLFFLIYFLSSSPFSLFFIHHPFLLSSYLTYPLFQFSSFLSSTPFF